MTTVYYSNIFIYYQTGTAVQYAIYLEELDKTSFIIDFSSRHNNSIIL